jgi:LysM repeat protein
MRKFITAGVILVLMGTTVLTAKVIGRVNGYPITEKAANAFLKIVTKGKLKYHQLRPKDKKDVVQRIAVDALLIGMAKKKLSEQERNQVVVNFWLAQKIHDVKVEEKAIEEAYTSNKKFFKDTNGEILPFEKVKDVVAVSLKQKKYVAQLMEKAKITMGKKVIKSSKKGKSSKKNKAATNGKTTIYVVKSGNTLSGIAHKHHITTKELRKMNGMKEKDTLKIGQKLKVPGK